jgi:predicted DNA-binding helix-hairpin-helix protein
MKRKRTTFKPDELVTTFVSLQREKRVDGLFLPSGFVPDADTTMGKMWRRSSGCGSSKATPATSI